MAAHFLSKTSYLRGVQCEKAAYLYVHHPSKKDPIPPERLARFGRGHVIGDFARKLYPGGIDIREGGRIRPAADVIRTRELINNGTQVFYEAAFVWNNVLVYVDILRRTATGWEAIEVKSSTSAKQVYLDDTAIQYTVLKNSGLSHLQMYLVLLKLPQDQIDERNALSSFYSEEVTAYCLAEQQKTEKKVQLLLNTLAKPSVPSVAMGSQCKDPYTCDFIGFCSAQHSEPSTGLFG